LEFRIGVNLGDVMVEGAQIYGDRVNVAARLESLSDPGGRKGSRTPFLWPHVSSSVTVSVLGVGSFDRCPYQ